MRYILAILTILCGSAVAKAGYPYYYYYEKPEFFVAPQLIPVVVHHKNFVDKNRQKHIEKIEVFAPIIVEQHTFYRQFPPHPNFRR